MNSENIHQNWYEVTDSVEEIKLTRIFHLGTTCRVSNIRQEEMSAKVRKSETLHKKFLFSSYRNILIRGKRELFFD